MLQRRGQAHYQTPLSKDFLSTVTFSSFLQIPSSKSQKAGSNLVKTTQVCNVVLPVVGQNAAWSVCQAASVSKVWTRFHRGKCMYIGGRGGWRRLGCSQTRKGG